MSRYLGLATKEQATAPTVIGPAGDRLRFSPSRPPVRNGVEYMQTLILSASCRILNEG